MTVQALNKTDGDPFLQSVAIFCLKSIGPSENPYVVNIQPSGDKTVMESAWFFNQANN
jgi:hypothetical protein